MTDGAWLYILRCSDGSYYVGTTRTSLEARVVQHNAGAFQGYTLTRRPVELIFSQWFDRITDAIENERKLKKWSRAKKQERGVHPWRLPLASTTGKARVASPFETPREDARLLRMRERWSDAPSLRSATSLLELTPRRLFSS